MKPTQEVGEMVAAQVKRLAKSIRSSGFDVEKPISVGETDAGLVILDGHHRAAAGAVAERDVAIESVGKVEVDPATWSLASYAQKLRRYIKW